MCIICHAYTQTHTHTFAHAGTIGHTQTHLYTRTIDIGNGFQISISNTLSYLFKLLRSSPHYRSIYFSDDLNSEQLLQLKKAAHKNLRVV